MKRRAVEKRCFRAAASLVILTALSARAHLMVAQKGTLNISGNGAYMVISIPVSALQNVDSDGDHLLSAPELNEHSNKIIQQISDGLQLRANSKALPLQGVMLNLSPKDSDEGQVADQLIAMGRFALNDPNEKMEFRCSLWGTGETEKSLSLTITKELKEAHFLMLSPTHSEVPLYESPLNVVLQYINIGARHVLSGLDHLLFLLLAIVASFNWKRILAVLSVFTIGHALSLMAVVIGEVTAPKSIVEPTIAATIVALAVYDGWAAKTKTESTTKRLIVVFICSLIHGLGLAGALSELGLYPAHQVATLLGFNVGIELGQLVVAALVFALAKILASRFHEAASIEKVFSWVRIAAVMVGIVWFIQLVPK
jgi:hypothetical protein